MQRADGQLALREDDAYRYVASHSMSPEWDAIARDRRVTPGRGTVLGRTALEGGVVHVADVAADPEYALAEAVTVGKLRTALGVPLLRESEVIGVITLNRQRVAPFTERQIELVRTFADQAVIAIENARLITETREALEQQTATAEVLQVINSSPGDLAPVFDAMLEKAMRLCEASFGGFLSFDGEFFRPVAHRGLPVEFVEAAREPVPPTPGGMLARIAGGEAIVHIADLAGTEAYRSGNPSLVALADIGGAHTAVWVALRRDEALLGVLVIYRQEVRPFSDKQIALVQNFAAQAVIAMENARLLDEHPPAPGRIARHLRQHGRRRRHVRQGAAPRRLEPQFPADPRPAGSGLGRAAETYGEYFRYLAERGEFGAVDIEAEERRYAENVTRQWSVERTRPDGRVLEVRHNPVPGGGFVLIYGDITERKEAEARLSTARDTAEAVSRELKAAQASLIHAEKMASLGQLTAGIAHEIKNPLNFVNNFAGLSVELLGELKAAAAPAVEALGGEVRDEIDELVATLSGNLDRIAEHGRRADGIVRSMLLHSRGGSGDRQSVDLNALVDDALNLAYHGARARDQRFNITLERDLDPALAPIEIVPQDMTQISGSTSSATASTPPTGAGARGRPRPRSGCATTAPALPPNTARNCSSRSSPPSPPAKARGSASRSAGRS